MRNSRIEVQPIAGALGAEIHGVDLREVDDATWGEIHRAFLDHLVVFFRDQNLTPDQYLAFAHRFGKIARYPFGKGMDSHPEIFWVVKEKDEKVNFGGLWHSDTTYLAEPPAVTMLYAVETPDYGGDTLFANMYLAYETLSEGMRRILDPLRGINSAGGGGASHTRRVKALSAEDLAGEETFVAEHPIVRTHPETGRKGLYLNLGHTRAFAGMTEEESAPLLKYLAEHAVRPEFTCRFRWRPGSIAVWDNRCAQHNPINDYHGRRRAMQRITVGPEKPA